MYEKTEALYKICKALMKELEEYSKRIEKTDEMNAGDLEVVDKLSHALKSIKTTIAMIEAEDEGGYSGRYIPRMGGYYDPRIGMSYASDGRDSMMSSSNRGGNDGGMSNARGRRNAPRDSMIRYSGNDGGYSYAADMDSIMRDLDGMMDDMPADKQRRVQQLMNELRR